MIGADKEVPPMRVLLATDGSRSADRARDLTASLPWPDGTVIRVVSGLEPRGDLFGAPWVLPTADDLDRMEEELLRHVNDTLDDAERRLAKPGISVERLILRDRPGTAVVEEARAWGADLIVLGNRGHSRIGTMILGSTSAEVVDHAPCPVLVARDDVLAEIVLAEDGSPGARLAERVLTDWRVFHATPVGVLSVAETGIPWNAGMAAGLYDEVMASYWKDVETARGQVHELAEATAQRLRVEGIAATAHVREGDAAHEIVEYAREKPHRMVVMGSRGHTGLARLVLGGVARNVLTHAPGSVLIVRENAAVHPDEPAREAVAAG
jgi:nucleotide-binding universal stress UspA family protein